MNGIKFLEIDPVTKAAVKKEYSIDEISFVEKKLKNLVFEWKFRPKEPWYIPVKAIREYYGEKIALYFMFLGFYTK